MAAVFVFCGEPAGNPNPRLRWLACLRFPMVRGFGTCFWKWPEM